MGVIFFVLESLLLAVTRHILKQLWLKMFLYLLWNGFSGCSVNSGMLVSFLNPGWFVLTTAKKKQKKPANTFYHKTYKVDTTEVLLTLILHFLFLSLFAFSSVT